MLASGAVSTRRKDNGLSKSRIVGAMALLVASTVLFLARGPSIVQTQIVTGGVPAETPALTGSAVDKRGSLVTKDRTETHAELPNLPSASEAVERQDRFEVDRFIRRSAER